MLSKTDFYKKVKKSFDDKPSIFLWFNVLYIFYKKKEMTEKEVFSLLSEVNKNQT